MPEPFRSAHRWWNRTKLQRWCGRTTEQVISEVTTDNKLAAVLKAQWGTYGGLPSQASFGIHATIIRHYLEGAAYPVGGAGAIAARLIPVIEAAGGSARPDTPVSAILIEAGQATGVRTEAGEILNAPVIVSAVGAGETVNRLLPADFRKQPWALEIAELKPSICQFELFLGFQGDIQKHGATRSNHWFHQSWDANAGL